MKKQFFKNKETVPIGTEIKKIRSYLNLNRMEKATFVLIDNQDSNGVQITNFKCNACESCSKGEPCEFEDDPPTEEEISSFDKDLIAKEIQRVELESQKKDPLFEKLKIYLNPDCFKIKFN